MGLTAFSIAEAREKPPKCDEEKSETDKSREEIIFLRV
jgi:hypothetical protein